MPDSMTETPSETPPRLRARRPAPSRLPIHYFALGHLYLVLAFAGTAVYPHRLTGFFYGSWIMAPVHLVTLGWITCSILGALYMIAPMALRSRLAETRLDKVAFVFFGIGVSGMVSHFWIDSYGGLLWSATWVLLAVSLVGYRTVGAVRGAPVALGVKLHLGLAFVNFWGVALLGAAMGLAKIGHAWFGAPMSNLFAHFHLAAIGWVLMMVFGAAYRLLPMLIPAAVPQGAGPVASACLLQLGSLGLVASLAFGQPWLEISCLLTLGGIATFFVTVVWMLRHRKPRAKGLPSPDVGLLHIAQAMLYLLLSVGLGTSFVFGSWPEAQKYEWIPVYGIFVLLGFAAQMVLGVGARLFPLYSWLLALADGGFETPPASPHGFAHRRLQLTVFGLWTLGVPWLAAGLLLHEPSGVVAASVLLGLAALGSGIGLRRILHAAKGSSPE